MTQILLALTYAFLLITILWFFRIHYAHKSISQSRRPDTPTDLKVPIHIILPVLNENRRLKDFVKIYRDLIKTFPSMHLYLVTTEREKELYPKSSTLVIAEELSKSDTSIKHVHFPKKYGVVAHQLNYAINTLPSTGFTAIYNADSLPDKRTFEWILSRNPGTPQAFQQYGVYDKNIEYLLSRPFKNTLVANMHWQTRWAFGIEYFKAAAGHLHGDRPILLRYFNYCISHGLFVTTPLLKEVGFSEKTINEDAIFGIELALRDIPIQPVPYFDTAESPDSPMSIYNQKTNWFQGCFQAPVYFRLLSKNNKNSFKLLVACGQFFAYSLYWIIGPVLSLVTIILAVICTVNYPLYLLCGLSPILFLVAPTIFNQYLVNKIDSKKENLLPLTARLAAGSLLAYFIHGAAGINGILQSSHISRGHKKKTPMYQDGELN